MKICAKCKENFTEDWKFCPFDRTLLSTTVLEETKIAKEFSSEVFSNLILKDHNLFLDLIRELREVARSLRILWSEIKRDPLGFLKKVTISAKQWIKQYFSRPWRKLGYGYIVVGLLFSAIITFTIFDSLNSPRIYVQTNEELEITMIILETPYIPEPEEGPAGTASGVGGGSKKEQERPGGGGGGGRKEILPASIGKLPQADLRIPQIVAPDPNPPTITNPELPVPATITADPVLFPTDRRDVPYGDPNSKSTQVSSGTGTGNGIGNGTGGGVGTGTGSGVGPGTGGNTGGGNRNDGGGGPGGGGGGKPIYSSREVDLRAQVLSKPEPKYTEEARKNKVTGTVIIRAIFSSDGTVKNINTTRGLPNGLTEKAIEAARQIKFKPAMKDGKPVSTWMQLEYNFNLY